MDNPLLHDNALPPFAHLKPEHIQPAIEQILAQNRQALEALAAQGEHATWDSFVGPLEAVHERLDKAWAPVGHLHAVADNEELRAAYNACLPQISAYYSAAGHHEGLYRAYRAVRERADFEHLPQAKRKAVDNALRLFHLSGVDLSLSDKARFKEWVQAQNQLSTQFGEHVQDATHSWHKLITDIAQLDGVPESTLALLRHQAQREGQEGWQITLDAPSYIPLMAYAHNRALRQELYTAYFTRASDQGPNAGQWDNRPLMDKLLSLRQQQAELLGYANYAELSLADKMAQSPVQVIAFLRDLVAKAKPFAQREWEQLSQFAAEQGLEGPLQLWDVPYYSDQLRLARYAFNQETLRPYFPLNRVLQGLFDLLQRLFRLRIEESTGVEVWHPDARFFTLYDEQGQVRGMLFMDLFARKHKRGGAWMDESARRKRTADGVQVPVAYVNCNFPQPVNGTPSLLTHENILTLFHEMGHALHHLLTQVEVLSVSGIGGVPWDAVELPSQCLEYWCWEPTVLNRLACHYQTGEALPQAMLDQLMAAKHFQTGLFLVRQLEFALFDMRMHAEYEPHNPHWIDEVLAQTRQEVAVVTYPPFNRFANTFSHIFSGGYAAGYYSYLWAEVLSADVFAAFEEEGIENPQTGQRYLRCILEAGGSDEPLALFCNFRGRTPQIDAMLRHAGLTEKDHIA